MQYRYDRRITAALAYSPVKPAVEQLAFQGSQYMAAPSRAVRLLLMELLAATSQVRTTLCDMTIDQEGT